jgi:hypothetical protein
MSLAAGEKVRQLTLLEKMGKSTSSSGTRMMITNSSKYGITTGSYTSEYFELTEAGAIVVNPTKPERERKQATFELGIASIAPFKVLYDHYKGKRLPDREVIKDVLRDSGMQVPDLDECVDTFIVNVKDLGLLRTIGGAETLVSIEQLVEELPGGAVDGSGLPSRPAQAQPAPPIVAKLSQDSSNPLIGKRCAST